MVVRDDFYYMKRAIKLAEKAAERDEVPIGALVVFEDKIVARAHNRRILDNDGTAHAEVLAIRKAGKVLGNWRLEECTLYVTLEPCAMCAGALINSRVKRLVFGAFDVRFGCCGSIFDLPTDPKFNHRLTVTRGVMEEECRELLSSFFRKKRGK